MLIPALMAIAAGIAGVAIVWLNLRRSLHSQGNGRIDP
jgi:hypothetical protein